MHLTEATKTASDWAIACQSSMAVCRLGETHDVIDVASLTADALAAADGSLVAVYGPSGEVAALPDLGPVTPRLSATMARLDRMVYGECIGFDTASGGWLTVYRSKTGYGVDRWPVPGGYSLTAGEVAAVVDAA